MDKKMSECLIGITGNLEQQEKLKQRKEQIQNKDQDNNESESSSKEENASKGESTSKGEGSAEENDSSKGEGSAKENNSSKGEGSAKENDSLKGEGSAKENNSSKEKSSEKDKGSSKGEGTSKEDVGSNSSKKSDNEEEGQSADETSKGNNDEGSQKSNESVNENASEEKGNITSMSMQYADFDGDTGLNWNEVEKIIQEIYLSWNTIESDLLTKNQITQSDLTGIKNCVDNLIISSSDNMQENFFRNTVDLYKNLYDILSKINYDKNSLEKFKVKQYIYEAYYNVLIDNWEDAQNCLNSASTTVQSMNNVDEQTKTFFSNLKEGIQNKNLFYIKCSDATKRLENI